MDPVRFDQLSKRLASTGLSRRRAVRGLSAAGLASALFALQRQPAAADCPDIITCWRGCLPQERSAGGFCDAITHSGMPNGPVGSCWNWSEFKCNPCQGTWADLDALCNASYSWCGGQCRATAGSL
jgi:hypothetical protein